MRQGREARRQAGPGPTGILPGPSGGAYKPLTELQLQRIHHAVLEVLETIGMADPIPIVREHALAKGCWLDDGGRLHFPRALVEDMIAAASRNLVFHGRDPRHDLDLSGNRVHTFGGGDSVTVLDVGAARYRPSTLLDVYDVARLVDRMDNIHAYARLVVATELSEQLLACDLNTIYASVAGTAKNVRVGFADARHVQPALEMLWMIAGGREKFEARPFCHGGGCPIISPLRYGVENSEVCIESVKFNAPVWVVTAPQAGATAPAALAGTLVQVTAEALAAMLMVNLVAPGHPVIIGAWPFISDLRTGAFTGGGGEEAIASAAAAQIIKWYGLTCSVGAGMSDAKSPDNQAGYEKALAITLAAHAGCNNVSESAGMMGSLMGLSYESMVIDNDMLGAILRSVRGIEVDDDTLSVEVIRNAVHGDGHYLRQPQTLELMRTEFAYPQLADRRTPGEWEEAGSPDIRTLAGRRVRELLSTHYPEYIDPAVDRRIRERFDIRLPAESMRAGSGRW
jgi:trimethylamine--corrinoid protein Co-methyltransferase